MSTVKSLIEDYQEADQRLREQETSLRWNYGEDIRKHIYVRPMDNVKRIPFTICPGEKRVRIDVDNICEDYMVCDKDTGAWLADWIITFT